MRNRGAAIGAIFVLGLLAPIKSYSGQMGLEAGLLLSDSFPFGLGGNENYFAVGLMGRASFDIEPWSFGVVSRGQMSTYAPFSFSSDGVTVSGNLKRRFISIGFVIRHFLPTRVDFNKLYLDAGFFGIQNDLIDSVSSFRIDEIEGDERLFFRGYAVSMGVGYHFPKTPLFLQLNYEYQKYDWLQIVGTRNLLNYVISEKQFDGTIIAHKVFLTVGLTGIF